MPAKRPARPVSRPRVTASVIGAPDGVGRAIADVTDALRRAEAQQGQFTANAPGFVPAAGTETASYLRADGAWATPPGTWLARQVLTGTGTYEPTEGTTRAHVEQTACGGGGGGAGGGAGVAAGAGGSSGVTLRYWVGTAGTALTGGAYSAPTSGGTAGSTAGGNGGDGSDATLVIGGATYTAKGGGGGEGMASNAGSALAQPTAPAAGSSSGATIISSWAPGGHGINISGAYWLSGNGAASLSGAGAIAGNNGSGTGAGVDAGGPGGGGSGATEQGAGGLAGGAGGAAIIIIDEYA